MMAVLLRARALSSSDTNRTAASTFCQNTKLNKQRAEQRGMGGVWHLVHDLEEPVHVFGRLVAEGRGRRVGVDPEGEIG
jgi:hypothetical protein